MSSPRHASRSASPIRPPPLSPSKVRFNLPQAKSTTSFLDDGDRDSTSDLSSEDDEDDRVFFGTLHRDEEELVARLSKAVPPTPRSRLKKRDSREFMRRKTILSTPPRRRGISQDEEVDEDPVREVEEAESSLTSGKKWPGGFHERREEDNISDYGSSPSSSSTSPTPVAYPETSAGTRITEDHCDLTLDFSRFRVSDSPLSDTPNARPMFTRRPSLLSRPSIQADLDQKSDADQSFSEEEQREEEWSGTEGEDSDKENAPAPMDPGVGEEEEEEKVEYPLFEGPLTGGRHLEGDNGDHDDIVSGLDMGGLRLIDFADPELDIGHMLSGTIFNDDISFSSMEPSESGDGVDSERDEGEQMVIYADEETVKLQVSQLPLASDELASNCLAPSTNPCEVFAEPVLSIPTREVLTEVDPNIARSTPSSPSPSSDSDSPLPLARGGPVIIPQMLSQHSPIRAESNSPYRSFSPLLLEMTTPPSMPETTPGPSRLLTPRMAFSPTSQPTSPTSLPSDASTTPTSRPQIPHNVTHQAKQPLRSSTLTASSSLPGPSSLQLSASPLPLPILASSRELPEEAAVKRSEAIKATLANVFAGKSLGLGKPQRSVSSASSYSSSSSSNGTGTMRPGSRTGFTSGMGNSGKGKKEELAVSKVQPVKDGRTIPIGSAATRSGKRPVATSSNPLPSASISGSRPVIVASSGLPRRVPNAAVVRPALASRPLPPSQPTRAASKPSIPLSRGTNPAPVISKPSSARPASRAAQLSNMPIFTCTQPLSVSSPNSQSYSVSMSNNPSNPLKRPLPFQNHPIASSRLAISAGSTRPTLGLPSRVVGDQVFTLSSTRMHMPAVSEDVNDGGMVYESEGGDGLNSVFGPSMPVFSLGVTVGAGSNSLGGRPRSPDRMTGRLLAGGAAVKGTPMSVRASRFGTPSRGKLGTPSRNLGTPSRLVRWPDIPTIQVYSSKANPVTAAPKDVGATSTSPTSGPPSTNTRHHTDTQPSTSGLSTTSSAHRGSSEDHEDVSFALPALGGSSSDLGSSPIKTPKDRSPPTDPEIITAPTVNDLPNHGRDLHPSKLASTPASSLLPSPTNNTRPKRSIKPPAPKPIPIPRRLSVAATTLSIAPNLSEKELKAKTAYNTVRNEKYHCAIEKQIIRMMVPRPPSPTSTIPTVEQREEEAKKRDREMRVKRRKGKGKSGDQGDVEEGEDEGEEVLPVIRRLEGGEVDWKGDEEGWEVEGGERPKKRMRMAGSEKEKEEGKWVEWDKGLVVIRDEGAPYNTGLKKGSGGKSALKLGRQVDLDPNGNLLPSRPKEPVKPLKVVVSVLVYEGEEPVVPISQATRGKKKASG